MSESEINLVPGRIPPTVVEEAPTKLFKLRNIRKRNVREISPERRDEEDDDAQRKEMMQDLLETQKLRKRPGGICVDTTSSRSRDSPDPSSTQDQDPMKMSTGGMVNMKAMKAMGGLPGLESGGQHIDIGTEFSAETQRRDEDYDMLKFIEDEMAKRKSSAQPMPAIGNTESTLLRKVTKPEDALLVVAEKYRREQGKKSEEMLSQQMLSGIPEVDLGIEAKIRNIEATEDAKKRLMQKYSEAPDAQISSTASNLAMDYMQHSRYNLDNYQHPADAKPDQITSRMKSSKNSPLPDKKREK